MTLKPVAWTPMTTGLVQIQDAVELRCYVLISIYMLLDINNCSFKRMWIDQTLVLRLHCINYNMLSSLFDIVCFPLHTLKYQTYFSLEYINLLRQSDAYMRQYTNHH